MYLIFSPTIATNPKWTSWVATHHHSPSPLAISLPPHQPTGTQPTALSTQVQLWPGIPAPTLTWAHTTEKKAFHNGHKRMHQLNPVQTKVDMTLQSIFTGHYNDVCYCCFKTIQTKQDWINSYLLILKRYILAKILMNILFIYIVVIMNLMLFCKC